MNNINKKKKKKQQGTKKNPIETTIAYVSPKSNHTFRVYIPKQIIDRIGLDVNTVVKVYSNKQNTKIIIKPVVEQ